MTPLLLGYTIDALTILWAVGVTIWVCWGLND